VDMVAMEDGAKLKQRFEYDSETFKLLIIVPV